MTGALNSSPTYLRHLSADPLATSVSEPVLLVDGLSPVGPASGTQTAGSVSEAGPASSSIEWRQIPSCPGYEASSEGQIRRVGNEPMRGWLHANGYMNVRISLGAGKICRRVNRLVCEAFHGPAPRDKPQAAHSDGDRINNQKDNLRWASRSENERDKRRHGTAFVPTPRSAAEGNAGQAKITAAIAAEIRRQYLESPRSGTGQTVKRGLRNALALEFGIARSTVGDIISGKSWTMQPIVDPATSISSSHRPAVASTDCAMTQDACGLPHRYEKYGSFGATCVDCRIGTIWDSAERREPSPCGARS